MVDVYLLRSSFVLPEPQLIRRLLLGVLFCGVSLLPYCLILDA